MDGLELEAARVDAPPQFKVWDPLVRLFHWSLVASFAFSYLTGDEWKQAHIISGYAIICLLFIRVAWGIVGSRHARFSSFIYRPSTILGFIQDSLAMKARRYVGHNPAGGAMVITLLVAISGIVTTGYMMTTDTYWGIEWVEDTHEVLVNITLGLVLFHIGGVLLASL